MAYQDYKLISVTQRERVVTAVVNNPPVNIITLDLFAELGRLSQELFDDKDNSVFVLKSADPDFFLAHFDVSAILTIPIDRPVRREAPGANPFHAMCDRFAKMDMVSIAQIEGRVGGGGSELSMSLDMRFGVLGKTIVNQMEVPLGILPGGSGTLRLPQLIGRGRALEVITGGIDLDAQTAECWGYLNRALPATEIGPYVERLAHRIASFPKEAIQHAKACVNLADGPSPDNLIEESHHFQTLVRTDSGQRNMKRFLEIGGQTREGEMRVAELSGKLGEK